MTLRRQLSQEESGSGGGTVSTENAVIRAKYTPPKIVRTDVYMLEIFDRDGALLGRIPLAHNAHALRAFRDFLFIRDDDEAMFYQYQIVEQ